MNDLASMCPCGHSAYQHRTIAQTTANLNSGKHYVGECTGHRGGGDTGACCQCQVDRQQVIDSAKIGERA